MKKVKRNVATICTLATIGFGTMSYVPLHANAASIHSSEEDPIDFENHSDQATSYVKDAMKKQEKQMGSKSSEVKKYDQVTDTSIHKYLIDREKGVIATDSKLDKKIDGLDVALNKATTADKMKVYSRIDLNDPMLSNYQKIGNIIPIVGYAPTDLVLPAGNQLIFEIEVPKGTHAAFTNSLLGNNVSGLLIERGGGLQITNVRDTYDMGIKRTRITARYVSKQEMENIPKDFFGNEKGAEDFAFNKVGRLNNQEENLQAIEDYIHDISTQLELDHYIEDPNGNPKYEKQAQEISDVVTKQKLQQPVKLYFATTPVKFIKDVKPKADGTYDVNHLYDRLTQLKGTIHVEKSFIPGSLHFALKNSAAPVLIEMNIPKGTQAVFISDLQHEVEKKVGPGQQYDLLLNENNKYRIDKVEKITSAGETVVKMIVTLLP